MKSNKTVFNKYIRAGIQIVLPLTILCTNMYSLESTVDFLNYHAVNDNISDSQLRKGAELYSFKNHRLMTVGDVESGILEENSHSSCGLGKRVYTAFDFIFFKAGRELALSDINASKQHARDYWERYSP